MTDIPGNYADGDSLYADRGDNTLRYKDEDVANLLTRQEAHEARLRKENDNLREELKSLRDDFLSSRGNGKSGGISELSKLDWANKEEESPVRANDASLFGADVEKQGHGERRLPHFDVAGENFTNDDDMELLPHDTFSFLAFAKPLSSTFLCGTLVFASQLVMLVFLTISVFQTGSDGNLMGVPPNVIHPIRVLQVFTLVIIVLSQNDIHQSLNVLYFGYDEKSIQDAFGVMPSRNMWRFSLIVRLAQGMLGLCASFFLIMSESSAKEILLNFTAVTFISFLDDTAFIMANWGYFGKTAKESARAVRMAQRSPSNDKKKFPRVIFLLLTLAVMLSFWGFIFYKQETGRYLCSTVFVQFDDEFSPALGAFSGLYNKRRSSAERRGRRVEYVEQHKGSFDGSAILGYCDKESAWTLSFGDNFYDEPDSCQWRAKSSEFKSYEADSFDIMSTSSFPWFTRNLLGREVPMEHFHLSCYDCENDAEFCGGASRGLCVKNRCECVDGWYGYRCEHQDPCPVLEINTRNDGFLGSRTWSNKFNLLRSNHEEEIVNVYGHPVYLSEPEESFDVIFFTGRRWALTFSTLLDRNNSTTVADYFDKEFHGHWSNYNVAFLSQPVDVDTVEDVSISPKGLIWFQAEDAAISSVTNQTGTTIQVPNRNRPSTAVLLCAACDNATNPCFYEGVCNKDGTCTCVTGSTGVLCQESPNGNGLCDTFFNIPEYGYDGGDCCMASCISTEDFKCGKNISSTVFEIPMEEYVGYPHCRDPRQTCDSAHGVCWKPSSIGISGASRNTEAGHSVSLSSTGEVLAVAEPGASRVRIFSQDGMQWTPRGQILEGPSGSRFGTAMTLSNDGQVVAIGAILDRSTSYVQVFEWETKRSEWIQRGEDIIGKASYLFGDIFISFSVSLSSDGKILAIGSPGFDISNETEFEENNDEVEGNDEETFNITPSNMTSPPADDSGSNVWGEKGLVRVYSYSGGPWEQLGRDINDGSAFDNFGQSVALSGNGDILAVGAPQPKDEVNGVILPGYVRVYKLEDYKWNRLGNKIIGGGARGDRFGWSITLSNDGSIVASANPFHDSRGFADSGQVQIYQFNSNDWMQLGEDLFGNRAVDYFGWSVSLSSDGYTIAVGASQYVNVFKYDAVANQWDQQGQFPGFQASLSGSGALLAIWSPTDDGGGLLVRVYGNPDFVFPNQTFSNITKPLDVLVPVTVSLQFDSSPEDIELNLVCGNTTLVAFSPGTFNVPNGHVVETFRVVNATECRFTITDSVMNGICCSKGRGGYGVYYGDDITKSDNLLALGGQLFRSREEVAFLALPPSSVSLVPITVVLKLDVIPWKILLNFQCGDRIISNSEVHENGFILERLGLISQTFLVEEGAVCHFNISDLEQSGGLCCRSGFGFYELYYGNNSSDSSNLIAEGAQFDSADSVTFRALPNSTLSAAGLVPIKIIFLLDTSSIQTIFSLKCGSNVLLNNTGSLIELDDVPVERTYFVQEESECLFDVLDTGGDGICCENRKGYIQIYTGKKGEEVLIYDEGEFGFGAKVNFTVSSSASEPSIHVDPVLTLPAPRCSLCEDGAPPCYPDKIVSYIQLGGVLTCRSLDLFIRENLLEGDLCSTARIAFGPSCGCGIDCGNETSLQVP